MLTALMLDCRLPELETAADTPAIQTALNAEATGKETLPHWNSNSKLQAKVLCISRGLSLSLLQILSVAALFRCSADRNFYFAHFASTIGNEATRLDTAASDALQSVLFVCVCRLGPWHATEVGRALNRGSGPNPAQARKRPDRSTTTQTCFQALDEVAFGRKDANELPGTGIEATPSTTIFSVTAHFGSSAAAVFSSSERDNPREMHNTSHGR